MYLYTKTDSITTSPNIKNPNKKATTNNGEVADCRSSGVLVEKGKDVVRLTCTSVEFEGLLKNREEETGSVTVVVDCVVAFVVVSKGVVWVLRIVELFAVFGFIVVIVGGVLVVVVDVVECVEDGVISSIFSLIKYFSQ